jgi:hypothetical protein
MWLFGYGFGPLCARAGSTSLLAAGLLASAVVLGVGAVLT